LLQAIAPMQVLPAMLDNRTIKTDCKVIGGMFSDEFLLDFVRNINSVFLSTFAQVYGPLMPFRKLLGTAIT